MIRESKPFPLQRQVSLTTEKTVDLLIIAALFTAAVLVGFAATESGPGISPDSVNYISMGENIYRGNGFASALLNAFDVGEASPITNWPPGYALLIAGLMFFHLTAVEAARWVSILSLAFLLGVLYKLGQAFGGRLVGVTSSLIVLSLMPVLRIATFALSEMPFALLIGLAAAGFVQYVKARPDRQIYWVGFSGLCLGLAILTRYVGLIFIPAGLIILGVEIGTQNWGKPFRAWLRMASKPASLFLALSLLPIIPWLIRGKLLTGYSTGSDRLSGYHATFLQSVRNEVSTLASHLLPSVHLGIREFFNRMDVKTGLILLAALILLIGFAWLAFWRWRPGPRKDNFLKNPFPDRERFKIWLVLFIFVGVFLVGMLLVTSIVYFPDYDWARLLASIYPLLMVFLLGSWWILSRAFFRNPSGWLRQAVYLLPVGVLIIFYGIQSGGFVTQAALGQELSSPTWRDSQGIAWLSQNTSASDTIFSEKPAPISYWLGRSIRYLPYRSESARFYQMLADPPFDATGDIYILVFKGELGEPDPFTQERLTASDLAGLSEQWDGCERLIEFPDSIVYRISP